MTLGEASSLPKVKLAMLGPDLDLFRNDAFPKETFRFTDLSQGIGNATTIVAGSEGCSSRVILRG